MLGISFHSLLRRGVPNDIAALGNRHFESYHETRSNIFKRQNRRHGTHVAELRPPFSAQSTCFRVREAKQTIHYSADTEIGNVTRIPPQKFPPVHATLTGRTA